MVDSLKTFRQRVGVLLYDWPRYRASTSAPEYTWLRIHNRNETLEIAPDGVGVRCVWRWSSPLHAPRFFPSLGRRLFDRAMATYPLRMEPVLANAEASANPEVSFVIGHRGNERLPNLLATLESISAQTGVRIECIVVEQAANPTIADRLPPWITYHFCPSHPADALYNRALAFNAGAEIARGPLLVLHDNDMLVPTCYAHDLLARWRGGAKVINLKRFIFYLSEHDSRAILATRRIPQGVVPDEILQNLTGGGSLAVDREWYFEIGGHDEGFVGWGGEDVEFWDRATTGGLYPYANLPLIHLWHRSQPDKTPGKDSAAMQRLTRISAIPVSERITELKSRQTTKRLAKV